MQVRFKRAILSVYDKTGIEDLAKALHESGCEIISTGSTARVIEEAGVPVTTVDDVTGFPESFDGRVKTLHPKIHGGILANRQVSEHVAQMENNGIAPIDLVVVNLYPFTQTVESGASFEECIEHIDIGGPTLVRGAAKNSQDVAVIVDPERYPDVKRAAVAGGFDLRTRRQLAAEAFAHTAAYDIAVADWMFDLMPGGKNRSFVGASWQKVHSLRYGENPHQSAALYTSGTGRGLANASQISGKEMSYNNYQDVDAALRAAYDHEPPAVAVVKHANPCGVAVGETIAEAHRKAHACDPVSAYGGVIAANRLVTADMAEQIRDVYTEVIAAPDYSADALEILMQKKNLRILVVVPERSSTEYKPISGGMLVQDTDELSAPGDDPANWTLAAGESADDDTLADLSFAWRAVRSVRSNAILLAKDRATVGIGMGQVNRVDSCRLAVERANTEGRARGSVAASDAFFPFTDGFDVLADAGVRAVVQPGGSIRDNEVVAAAQRAGITMYFTGVRHFSH